MSGKIRGSIQRHGHGSRADRNVWRGHANEIDEKWNGEDGAPSSDEPQREPDKGARGKQKNDWNEP